MQRPTVYLSIIYCTAQKVKYFSTGLNRIKYTYIEINLQGEKTMEFILAIAFVAVIGYLLINSSKKKSTTDSTGPSVSEVVAKAEAVAEQVKEAVVKAEKEVVAEVKKTAAKAKTAAKKVAAKKAPAKKAVVKKTSK
jgi:hypothetical protein